MFDKYIFTLIKNLEDIAIILVIILFILNRVVKNVNVIIVYKKIEISTVWVFLNIKSSNCLPIREWEGGYLHGYCH